MKYGLMKYSFLFEGQISPDTEKAVVQQKLARLFGINTDELDPIFDGMGKFQRDDLDEVTARLYKKEFSKVGAIGVVSALEANLAIAQEPRSTPSVSKPKPPSASPEFALPRVDHKAQRASHWLKWSSLAIIGIVIADRILKAIVVPNGNELQTGIDIGIWPVLLAHIPLIYGCFLLAEVKKLPRFASLLGIFSIAGVAILLLLPDKLSSKQKMTPKMLVFAAFSCSLFIYAISSYWSTSADLSQFLASSDALQEGRTLYPNGRQKDLSVLVTEQAEMRGYLNDTLRFIEEGELRPDDVSIVADKMFHEFSKYVVWRNYQRFVYHTTSKKMPKELNEESSKQDQVLFRNLISQKVTPLSNARLWMEYNYWFVAPSESEIRTAEASFGKFLDHTFQAVQDAIIERSMTRKKDSNKILLKTLPPSEIRLREHPLAPLTLFDTHFEYRLKTESNATQKVAIGVMMKDHKNVYGDVQQRPTIVVLSAELPVKYMSNLMGVFGGYRD